MSSGESLLTKYNQKWAWCGMWVGTLLSIFDGYLSSSYPKEEAKFIPKAIVEFAKGQRQTVGLLIELLLELTESGDKEIAMDFEKIELGILI